MMSVLQSGLQRTFRRAEDVGNAVFTDRHNPFYQLGALAFFYFWLAAGTGIYLFIFFDTSVTQAYASVERLTHAQWFAGGVMRSVHRYASAAMAVTVTLHLLREFALGRFRTPRAFSWISGVPLLWLLFAAAIGGYWLVWDQLALYIAVTTTEWLDALPFFGGALARNFLAPHTVSDRLFSLLVFLHIALPLFLLGGMFIHIKRVKLARINPSKSLAWGTLSAMVAVAFVKPAVSMGPADLSHTPSGVNLDWVYLNVYPLIEKWGPAAVWALLVGLSTLLVAIPFLARKSAPVPGASAKPLPKLPAVVDPANCNGCGWCFKDCPYDAISMIPHTQKTHARQALVNADLCTACGICEGACPSATPFRSVAELVSGIEIPEYTLDTLKKQLDQALSANHGRASVVVFGCDHGAPVAALGAPDTTPISLPCIGLLPPSFADFVSRQPNVKGVMVTGCLQDDCFYRKGSEWTAQRFAGQRYPHLRTAAGQAKVKVCLAGPLDVACLADELRRFVSASPVASQAKEGAA